MGEMKKMVLIVAGLAGFGTWEARPENKIDFARDIQPILQKSCMECHGPEKPKGKLRLDSREAALKGGKDGVVIVPGQADKSEVYRRIRLPAGVAPYTDQDRRSLRGGNPKMICSGICKFVQRQGAGDNTWLPC